MTPYMCTCGHTVEDHVPVDFGGAQPCVARDDTGRFCPCEAFDPDSRCDLDQEEAC